MKRFVDILLVGLMLGGTAKAQNVSVEGGLDIFSSYNWRGFRMGGVENKLSLQPGITFGFGESGLSFNIWGAAYAKDRSVSKFADELDFTIDYSRTLSNDSGLGISIGYIQYTFPSAGAGAKHSEEPYIGIFLDNAFGPALTFYYDFGLADAWYLSLSGGYDVPMGDSAPALSIGASVGLSDYGGKTGFNDFTATASVGFALGQFSVAPAIGYSYADNKLGNADNSSFWGGISIGFALGE